MFLRCISYCGDTSCFCVVSVIVVTLDLINAYFHLILLFVPEVLMEGGGGDPVPHIRTLFFFFEMRVILITFIIKWFHKINNWSFKIESNLIKLLTQRCYLHLNIWCRSFGFNKNISKGINTLAILSVYINPLKCHSKYFVSIETVGCIHQSWIVMK